jgi:hypothetical protein
MTESFENNGDQLQVNLEETERYGSICAWAKEIQASDDVVANRLKGIQGISGRTIRNVVLENSFYPESIVHHLCSDLINRGSDHKTLPTCDRNGFLLLTEEGNSVRYGNRNAWAKELGIAGSSMRRNLRDADHIEALDSRKSIRKMYRESIVRKVCSDHLKEIPEADQCGFFEIEGIRYGTRSAWKTALKCTSLKVDLVGITGGDKNGQIRESAFLSETQIRDVLKISERKWAPNFRRKIKRKKVSKKKKNAYLTNEGFLKRRKVKYATIQTWSAYLNIPYSKLYRLLKGVIGERVRNPTGGASPFYYSEGQILTALQKKETSTNLKEGKPYSVIDKENQFSVNSNDILHADKNGFFELDGIQYGNKRAWGEHFGVSSPTVRKALKDLKGITGENSRNMVIEEGFYSELIVRPLLEGYGKLPVADETGFFVLTSNGHEERYGSKNAWLKEFNVKESTLKVRLRKLPFLDGRTKKGTIYRFYPESAIRAVIQNHE